MKIISLFLVSSFLLVGGLASKAPQRELQLDLEQLEALWNIEAGVVNTVGDVLEVTFENGGGVGGAVTKSFNIFYNPNGDSEDSTQSCYSQGGRQLADFTGLAPEYSDDENTMLLAFTPEITENPLVFFPSPTEVQGPDGGFYTAAYLNLCVYFELQDAGYGVNFREVGVRITYFTENNFEMNIDTIIDINAGQITEERRFTLVAEECNGAEEIGVGVPISVCIRTPDYPFVQLTGIDSLTFQAPAQLDGSQPTQVVINNGATVSSALTALTGCNSPVLGPGESNAVQTCQVDSQLINALYAPGGSAQTISAFGKANVQYGNGQRRKLNIVLLRGSSASEAGQRELAGDAPRYLQKAEDSAFDMKFTTSGVAVSDEQPAASTSTSIFGGNTLLMLLIVVVVATVVAVISFRKLSTKYEATSPSTA